jgi:hypothetical protein
MVHVIHDIDFRVAQILRLSSWPIYLEALPVRPQTD